jgi:hypothetical protein
MNGSAEGTLNIEEHSFAEDDDRGDGFLDDKFKNKVVKINDITDLLKGEDQGSEENPSTSGKSEPRLADIGDD